VAAFIANLLNRLNGRPGDIQSLTAWIIALFCIALSTLTIWPFATAQGVIVV
jgi:hypothetical protein